MSNYDVKIASETEGKSNVQIMAKIIEELDTSKWLLESLDKERQFLVFIDDEVVYEEGIATDLAEGNIIMLNAYEEDKETYRVLEILANNRDEIISIDPRETISGFLGVFPDVLLDCENREITVSRQAVIAIRIERDGDPSWSYDSEKEALRLLSHHIEDGHGEMIEYWGFVADYEDEVDLHFTRIDDDHNLLNEVAFYIKIQE